jgi:hypothetical protein
MEAKSTAIAATRMVWMLFNRAQIKLAMIQQRSFRVSLATLLLCLCVGSLMILPMTQGASLSMVQISEADPASCDLLDQAEFDEESFVAPIAGAAPMFRILSRFGPSSLHFQTASLSPASPPPKHS